MQSEPNERETFESAIGQLLVERGKLDRSALERAVHIRNSSSEGLEQLLPKLGLASERDVAQAIADHLKLPLVTARSFPNTPLLADKVSPRFLRETGILPLSDDEEGLVVAMSNPQNAYALDAMRLISGREVLPRVAVPAELESAIDRLYAHGGAPFSHDGDVPEWDEDSVEYDVERLKDLASEAPVIRIVNQLITKAVEARASDVHIEPFENMLRIRYRIDGILEETEAPPFRLVAAIVSRIKIIARLNIAERRLPQDGRTKLIIQGTPVDLRVSTMPTMHGESVVLRILDNQAATLNFEALGIRGRNLEKYLDVLQRPHGVVLVTGPTGSGKTTTLYASLLQINDSSKKIVTVEDPIEYQLEGINQVQVKPGIGLDFANVLRSILRHDPDVILIGEIRDVETAEIAIQAALTGHLVLSTLHTNNAASAVTRLRDMGVEEYLLTSTLSGVLAQRLVRTLCPHCREEHPALPELVKQLDLERHATGKSVMLYRSTGCEKCNGSGYYGRTSIAETLVMTDAIRQLVLRRTESMALHRAAVEAGMQTMFDDGIQKALAGITTIEEVLRVTRDI